MKSKRVCGKYTDRKVRVKETEIAGDYDIGRDKGRERERILKQGGTVRGGQ